MTYVQKPRRTVPQRRFPANPERLRGLALREYLLGNLSLDTASGLAGMDEAEFAGYVAELALEDCDPDPPVAPLERPASSPKVSVVVPVYNEEDNLEALYDRLAPVLSALGSYEIVFVDDGSRDRSTSIVKELRHRDPSVRLLSFSRNFGHQAALSAGLDHARGDAIVFMDADLQDPPEILPELVRQWETGHEVVYAVRRSRDEGLIKRATARIYYRVLRTLSDIDIPVDTGDFCLIDRRVADVLRSLPEKNRFMRGLRSWAGFRQVGVPYDRPARHAGDVKYTFRKMIKLALDGLMAFTSLPLRLASWLGFLTMTCGLAYLAVTVITRMTTGSLPTGWASLVTIMLLLGGAQLIVLGVLGAYVARVYDEAKSRPMYIIDTVSRRASVR